MIDIPFGRPDITDVDREAVMRVLNGHILTHGPECKAFETEFSSFLGAGANSVTVSSCMAALHLAYLHMKLGPGDEVIAPACTHVATVHAIEWVGAKPVLVDPDPATGNLTAKGIEAAITPRTKAVGLVHFVGIPCEMDEIVELCERKNLALVEDCAIAIGARYKGKHVGLFGDYGTFSFYPVKHITTGEGGSSPDKRPAVRLATMRAAGELQVPFTSGVLIGIGETRRERIESFLALRALNEEFGHIQEIIVQNFRAKDGTKMANSPEPDLDDLLWTIAVARIIFGPAMNIQAPPNLSYDEYPKLVAAGLNDWGGVSPVTPDHVNPEAPWPHLESLRKHTAECGKVLTERLAVYPSYTFDSARWQEPEMATAVIRAIDSDGFARVEAWSPGDAEVLPPPADIPMRLDSTRSINTSTDDVHEILTRSTDGKTLGEDDLVRLFQARGDDYHLVCEAADRLRAEVNGDRVSYVVNRNINYTNICYFRCQFCAFAKGKMSESLRGTPYDLALDEVVRRAKEAWERGATEVCMQGGIHPEYTGAKYIEILRAVKTALPRMHVHAFSPLEVAQGAETLGISVPEFLVQLKEAGLGTLPGTAAEVLDDEVRVTLCPDKLTTAQWLSVVEDAHRAGFRTTSTVMYGHIDGPVNWARHLMRLRELQMRTGGITEFVPLPFVHMEAPIYLKGKARRGPTFREAILMHAVARLALHPHITNIQVSWVKMGVEGVKACLDAGVNDMGGTLMNESISRAAGAAFGQELPPEEMERVIRVMGRTPVQRTTLYGLSPEDRQIVSFGADELLPIILTPAKKYERKKEPAVTA